MDVPIKQLISHAIHNNSLKIKFRSRNGFFIAKKYNYGRIVLDICKGRKAFKRINKIIKTKMKNKGFTLIELLVVIAIIGILAGIIVVAMGGAQKSANDAKLKSTMSQARSAAELYKINVKGGLNYNGLASDADMTRLMTEVTKLDSATAFLRLNTDAGIVDTKWCLTATMSNGTSKYCVDSQGASKISTGCTGTTGTTVECN
jgi:prepilin-type N-terminal cleavage/methylation domain-containing protein